MAVKTGSIALSLAYHTLSVEWIELGGYFGKVVTRYFYPMLLLVTLLKVTITLVTFKPYFCDFYA